MPVVTAGTPTHRRTECADCGHDAMLTAPVLVLSDTGVTNIADYRVCSRCTDGA
jgi:ribosomal protein S27AE